MYGLEQFIMGFTIDGFLNALKGNAIAWGGLIAAIIGAIMMIAGVWKVGKGFISKQGGQTNWAMAIGAIVLGGMLLAGSWGLLTTVSNSVASEIDSMGGGDGNTWGAANGASIVWQID